MVSLIPPSLPFPTMNPHIPETSEDIYDSDCSCSCEDSDYTDCSCSSCECDSTCSSHCSSPRRAAHEAEVDKKIMRKLRFIEQLSKSCANSSNKHVLLNKTTGFSGGNASLALKKANSDQKEFDSVLNELYSSVKPTDGPTHSHPKLPVYSSFNSKELEAEMREIEHLLSDTSLDSGSGNYRHAAHSDSSLNGSRFPPSKTQSVTTLASSSAPSPNQGWETRGCRPLGGNFDAAEVYRGWPSGFNTPKYSYTDSDYEDPQKLFSMMVSLDLYSYMYVVENVLDCKVREALAESSH